MSSDLQVIKASGEVVPFEPELLLASLRRAGATADGSVAIMQRITAGVDGVVSTQKLYRKAFEQLQRRSRAIAARYRLKQAIMELGPSGFPFERFIARILEHEGYKVKVGTIVEGRCVKHEIDVIADRDTHHFMVECKYHNQRGRTCDVKIPLYVQARFKDVERAWKAIPGKGTHFHQGWLVTNTSFTADALQYGKCAGLFLMSWDYPVNASLKDRIERSGLYPITCLSSLTISEKERILGTGVVLCRELLADPEVLYRAHVRPDRINKVLKETSELCAALADPV